jgi:hypothetical protein
MENRLRESSWEWWAIGGLLLLLVGTAAVYHAREHERPRPITATFYLNMTVGFVLHPRDRVTVLRAVTRPDGHLSHFEPLVAGLEIEALGQWDSAACSVTLTLLATPAQAEKVRDEAEHGPPLIVLDEAPPRM